MAIVDNKVNVTSAIKGSISKDVLLKEIGKKAHELFIKRGGHHGNDLNDWLEAEKIVKKQYNLK